MSKQQVLGKLKSGQTVYNREYNHATDEVLKILPEIFLEMEVDDSDRYVVKEVKLDRIIGKTGVVEVDKNDEIFYGIRKNRLGFSKFVKNKEGLDTNSITIVLLKKEEIENAYVLITSFFGKPTAKEPYDNRASKEDLDFWKTHALVPKYDEILPETITDDESKYWVKQ